ncbi:hypothetical protein SLEP1_g24283 [Rubroshorea leprosula]|uniref:Uncharacterized protein n=1 Tax=Rubroshorea leprosula TaxID=152421 RepID=A0AAV5JL65_9ROSI|nr:hypothetical protein SLEP1_g24283 [Rubroshorea leprosula]
MPIWNLLNCSDDLRIFVNYDFLLNPCPHGIFWLFLKFGISIVNLGFRL